MLKGPMMCDWSAKSWREGTSCRVMRWPGGLIGCLLLSGLSSSVAMPHRLLVPSALIAAVVALAFVASSGDIEAAAAAATPCMPQV